MGSVTRSRLAPALAAIRRPLLGALALGVAVVVLGAAPALGQEPPPVGTTPTTPTTLAQVPTNDIVVKPNTGTPPASSGDRGGAAQVLLLGLLVAGVAGIGALVVRESRRARAQGGAADPPPAPGT
jgi:hypothetical protein